MFGKYIYRLFITFYPISIKLVSPFNRKAKLWSEGRKDIFKKLRNAISLADKIIWMHAASLGEFEQGRPVIEKLKAAYPSHKILVTFFSPSGYEVRKDYDGADYIFYLPMDSAGNAVKFYNIVNPRLVIFVKYEFWHFFLKEAKKRNIPLLLISAIFRKSQPFFSKTGSFHRNILSAFTHLFVQNEESVSLLKSIGFSDNVTLAGDTRFDRVIEIAEQFEPIPAIESFCGTSAVVVAGSTWTEDDKELVHFVNNSPEVKFIIAPHHISKDRIKECLRLYKNSILFSTLQTNRATVKSNILVIDNIGILSRLYKYATICFIGGGFAKGGIHNILEAAVWGKPVIHGPEYEDYFEAVELIEKGGAVSVANTIELEAIMNKLLQQDEVWQQKSKASFDYVHSKKGSTEKIILFIQENRLLTN